MIKITTELLLETVQNEPIFTSLVIGTDLSNSIGSYFGIGLSNRHGLTEELPFDVMGMVLANELVKRKLGLQESKIIIADSHAKTNGFDDRPIDEIAKPRREFLEKILIRLDFKNSDVVLGSDITRDPEHREIRSTINNRPYERLQLADMEFYRRRGRGIKIGWSQNGMDFDEKYFDDLFISKFGIGTTFVYTQPGRSLDGTPLPPYLFSPNKGRFLLKEDEDIDLKTSQTSRKTRAYFNQILDLFERLMYNSNVRSQNTEENIRRRIREVYGAIFGGRYI